MLDESDFDLTLDVLVIGAGAGGMAAALRAQTSGLDTLLVEKSKFFGGSTALSGGGIWFPGSARRPSRVTIPTSTQSSSTCERSSPRESSLTSVSAPTSMPGPRSSTSLSRTPPQSFVWKPGYPDYFPEVPGATAKGSLLNVEPVDLRTLGDDEEKLLSPVIIPPKGMWLRPLDLREFFRMRWSWSGKMVLLRFLWRMARARVLCERMAAIGQALAAQLWRGLRQADTKIWLESPLQSLITSDTGDVVGAVIVHDGREVQVGARRRDYRDGGLRAQRGDAAPIPAIRS